MANKEYFIDLIRNNPAIILACLLSRSNNSLSIPIKKLEEFKTTNKEIKFWHDIDADSYELRLVDK